MINRIETDVVVEESAVVLRVLGGDDEALAAQGDEVLRCGVEPLADLPCQSRLSLRLGVAAERVAFGF